MSLSDSPNNEPTSLNDASNDASNLKPTSFIDASNIKPTSPADVSDTEPTLLNDASNDASNLEPTLLNDASDTEPTLLNDASNLELTLLIDASNTEPTSPADSSDTEPMSPTDVSNMSLIDVKNIEPRSLYVVFTEGGHTARKMGILLTRANVQEDEVNFLLSAIILFLNGWYRAADSTEVLSEVLSDDFLSILDGNFPPHNAVKINAEPLDNDDLALMDDVMFCGAAPDSDELLETFLTEFLYRVIFIVNLDISHYVMGARQVARNVLKRTQNASPGEVVTLRSVMEMGPVEEQTGERVVRILE